MDDPQVQSNSRKTTSQEINRPSNVFPVEYLKTLFRFASFINFHFICMIQANNKVKQTYWGTHEVSDVWQILKIYAFYGKVE